MYTYGSAIQRFTECGNAIFFDARCGPPASFVQIDHPYVYLWIGYSEIHYLSSSLCFFCSRFSLARLFLFSWRFISSWLLSRFRSYSFSISRWAAMNVYLHVRYCSYILDTLESVFFWILHPSCREASDMDWKLAKPSHNANSRLNSDFDFLWGTFENILKF